MALKFLNKKGWHTGSLRNIETVWKAEQKHDAEKKKLEELKKQIKEEREAQEFRILQDQAGLAPKQERLDFLYDSGLAVRKASTDDYLLGKPIEDQKESEAKVGDGPGALFASKPQSANDAWRKLHSDPLLLIRQQEQAALAKIRNNPVKMEQIRKEVQEKSKQKLKGEKHKHKHNEMKKKGKVRGGRDGEGRLRDGHTERGFNHSSDRHRIRKRKLEKEESISGSDEEDNKDARKKHYHQSRVALSTVRQHKSKLSEDERAARLKEMLEDAELHEEQRWQRLNKKEEADAKDAKQSNYGRGKSFIQDANRSVYGAQNNTNASVSESVRRRAHYRDRHSADGQSNAFRR